MGSGVPLTASLRNVENSKNAEIERFSFGIEIPNLNITSSEIVSNNCPIWIFTLSDVAG